MALVAQPGGLQTQQPGGVRVRVHVADQAPDELVILDEGAELLAGRGVVDARLQAGVEDADAAPADGVAAEVECGADHVGDAEAGPGQYVGGRYAAAVEVHMGRHRGPDADHVLDQLGPQSGGVPLHEQGGGPFRGAPDDQEQVGALPVRDPLLVAVDHPVVAFAGEPGGDRGGVAARARLGHGERADALAAGQPGQPGLLLGVAAPACDRVRHHRVDGEQAAERGAGPSEFTGEQAEGDRVAATAAVLLGDGQPEQALLGEEADGFGRGALGPVVGVGVGCDVAVGEGPEFLPGLCLPCRERSGHRRRVRSRPTAGPGRTACG